MATEMEARAQKCPEGRDRSDYEDLARLWRGLAKDCTQSGEDVGVIVWAPPPAATKH